MENSKIEWTEHTFNPVRGCARISPGCDHCYAETMSHRNPKTLGVWGPDGDRSFAAESYWRQPIAWNRAAEEAGRIDTVFAASLGDLFEGEHVAVDHFDASRGEIVSEWEERHAGPRPDYLPMLARTREMTATLPHLRWKILTKRPWNAAWYAAEHGWPETWWAGCTVEDQARAEERIPWLLRVPARVRFLSCEPLLTALELRSWLLCGGISSAPMEPVEYDYRGSGEIDWVIVGGESGSNRRPMEIAWVRSIVGQCRDAGVPVFVKQDTGPKPGTRGRIPDDLWIKELPS